MNKVILYIATSQDGFIADEQGGVNWLPSEPDVEDSVGYQKFLHRISTIVMGRKSYDQILTFGSWAWSDKQTYVFTSRPFAIEQPYIQAVSASPKVFIEAQKKNFSNNDIWLLGGASLASSFAQEKLIDEVIITIVPQILQKGIRLKLPWEDFFLDEEKECGEGMVQKKYLLNPVCQKTILPE